VSRIQGNFLRADVSKLSGSGLMQLRPFRQGTPPSANDQNRCTYPAYFKTLTLFPYGKMVRKPRLQSFVTAGTRLCKPYMVVFRPEHSRAALTWTCYGRNKAAQVLQTFVPGVTKLCNGCTALLRPEHVLAGLASPCSGRNKPPQALQGDQTAVKSVCKRVPQARQTLDWRQTETG
jgi:hypothetical protein